MKRAISTHHMVVYIDIFPLTRSNVVINQNKEILLVQQYMIQPPYVNMIYPWRENMIKAIKYNFLINVCIYYLIFIVNNTQLVFHVFS